MGDQQSVPVKIKMKNQEAPSDNMIRKQEANKHFLSKDGGSGSELWTDGLLCAFEFVREQRVVSPIKHALRSLPPHRRNGHNPHKQIQSFGLNDLNENDSLRGESTSDMQISEQGPQCDEHRNLHEGDLRKISGSHWVPIGWKRIYELVQLIHADDNWSAEQMYFIDEESEFTVADVAAPYWERPAGPTWWCHVAASHVSINSWLSKAQWLHPAISVALRDESRLISDRMKYLLYEVPVRAAGGLLFELLGQSVGDPFCDEDDIPIVLRSWQAQNFLITALHMKGSALNINVLGITEVQEILFAGGSTAPRSTHEVIAHLACRLSRWDDRLFRKFVFGAADEIELKFVNRRNQEDLNLLSLILNQEIRKLAMQVIRVKWSLHAREEIVFELLQHLRGPTARNLLEGIRKSTREMLEEQEAVRGRLFTIQDVMQSTVRAWLQDRSLRITHNLTVFGGCGLVLSIITGLFGINVDGIPGAENTPYAFGLFSIILSVVGVILIGTGMLYFGLKRPITEEKVNVRKMELEQLVSMFQRDAETHAKVRQDVSRHNLPPTAADMISDSDYILIT